MLTSRISSHLSKFLIPAVPYSRLCHTLTPVSSSFTPGNALKLHPEAQPRLHDHSPTLAMCPPRWIEGKWFLHRNVCYLEYMRWAEYIVLCDHILTGTTLIQQTRSTPAAKRALLERICLSTRNPPGPSTMKIFWCRTSWRREASFNFSFLAL